MHFWKTYWKEALLGIVLGLLLAGRGVLIARNEHHCLVMCVPNDTVSLWVKIPADLAFEGTGTWKQKRIDRCIAPIVAALQHAGIDMRGSCCGHGKAPGEIVLEDGRILVIQDSSTSCAP